MIYYKTQEEIELIRESCLLVGKTLAEVAKLLKEGVTTIELDRRAEEFIRDNNALPAFKGYKGFPNSLCISVNSEVVHGIPGNTVLKNGDIVSIDCGIIKNGFCGDSSYTFTIGEVKSEILKLLKVTREALYKGIEQAIDGKRIGDIGFVIQSYVESNGFNVVRELVGHGIGRELQEKPQVPNYGKRGSGIKLKEGLVIAIEPMVNMGDKEVIYMKDGWTVKTKDDLPSAHFEHTVAVKKEKAEILSTFEYIEKILWPSNYQYNKTEQL